MTVKQLVGTLKTQVRDWEKFEYAYQGLATYDGGNAIHEDIASRNCLHDQQQCVRCLKGIPFTILQGSGLSMLRDPFLQR